MHTLEPVASTSTPTRRPRPSRGPAGEGMCAPVHAHRAANGMPPAVLSIAGSDCSGGAGIQADIKTMMACGAYAMTAITAITAQNTTGVAAVQPTSPDMMGRQIDAVFEDIEPRATKIGMIPNRDLIAVIAERLHRHHAACVVLDTVMVSSSGTRLIDASAVTAMAEELFPLATLITPNIPETEVLLGRDPGAIRTHEDMQDAGTALARRYGCAVLVKGGHHAGNADDALVRGEICTWMRGARVNTTNTHGTGCTLSSAIASHLALGETLYDAVRHAKDYLTGCLSTGLDLGHGSGPLDHAWPWIGERPYHTAE